MKKTILFLALVAFVFNVQAQEEENKGLEGAWWGMGAFKYSDDEATDVSTFTILPIAGTFISPSVTVGLGAGYQSTKVGDADADDTFILMPLVRKYWGVSDNFFIFGQADVPLTFNENANGYGFNVRPGIDYFIGGKWTIEATFGQFGYNSVKPDGGDAVGRTDLGFDMTNVQFGLKYIF